MAKFEEVAAAFVCPGVYRGGVPYGSGHINDTFRTVYEVGGRDVRYIHQRINDHVFKNVPALMENIGRVTRHQRSKYEGAGERDLDRRVLSLIPTTGGSDFFQDSDGGYWRTYRYIEQSRSVDAVEHTGQAFEAARAFGEFQSQLADLPVRLHETIPGFHHTRFRFESLAAAVSADPLNRAAGARAEIEFAMAREELVDVVTGLMACGDLPVRVTHNDTKLNNVLFDRSTGRGLCVIDLDTVMPGSVLYDFGDMVRSITSPVAEDEPDVSLVKMNINCFEALVQGYLETASGFLTQREKELLPFSGKLICFEIGLRFLADYLVGDTYFKTQREGQNLDRCRRQFALLRSVEEQMDAMQTIVDRCVV